jgi:TctA family transporter
MSDLLANLALGFGVAAQPYNILFCLLGALVGTLVGVLIFGFLSNILQLNNIDSNTQLVLKGMIILAAVLLQEGQAGRLLGPVRGLLRRGSRAAG